MCSLELCEWRGQNQRTLSVGFFPASLTAPSVPTAAAVAVATSSNSGPNPASASVQISAPVKGSLQHTGHGDINPDHSWGTPKNLEESVILLIHVLCSSYLLVNAG